MKIIRTLLWIVIACSGLAAIALAQQPAPVVLAVDVSRSLSAAELARAGEQLSTLIAQLPKETTAGLLVFADQPRWIAQPAAPPSALAEALRGLRPEGRFTLLYDALFAASSELEDGGVVVLVTDGRDENSATTLDDIARIYAERGIRIVALGAGNDPSERDLRRLALLSSGSYAGTTRELDPPALATATSEALAGIADRRAAAAAAAATASAPVPVPGPAPAAPGSGPTPSASQPDGASATRAAPERSWWWWPMVIAVALAILGGAALLLRGRGAARPGVCPRCGAELPAGASGECASCREAALVERLRGRPVAGPGRAVDAFLDTAVVPSLSLEQRLDRTAVMVDQPALVVKESGETPRSFALSGDQAFGVGREPGRNTLAIPSVSLSAEHFRVVPEQDAYFVLDLQSTNGTFLNGERVRAAKLTQGDRIRAGQVEFDFTVQQQFAPLKAKTQAPRGVPSTAS